jgi:uncharacterized protein (TIGR04255 family)
MKYSNAPISEVIFGITLKRPIEESSRIISFYCEKLYEKYPKFELSNPISDYIISEIGTVKLHFDPVLTGQALFRFRSDDRKFLIQIQKNKLYLNWIRGDEETVGHYPGFNNLYTKFNDILQNYLCFIEQSYDGIISCDLTYHNRIDLNAMFKKKFTVNNLFSFALPMFGERQLNLSYNVSELIDKKNFFLNTKIETLNRDEKNVLRYEHMIQSIDDLNMIYTDWFNEAHKIQIHSFEKTFSKKVLETWKNI